MIEEPNSGRVLRTETSPVAVEDVRSCDKTWAFPWAEIVKQLEVFKLVASENPGEILGLMSIERCQGFVRVHHLESSPPNVGRGKRFRGIPGNLLASAARLSFDLGNEGFIQLKAKTDLIDHYIREYGFRRLGNSHLMILGQIAAAKLIATFAERD